MTMPRSLMAAFFLSVMACRVAVEPLPHVNDGEMPVVQGGFYTVHEVRDGVVREAPGAEPFGPVLHLCTGEYVEADLFGTARRAFMGLRGIFGENGTIHSTLAREQVRHEWRIRRDESTLDAGLISFGSPSDRPGTILLLVRALGDRQNRRIALRYLGPRVARQRIKTTFLGHRGTCYFNPLFLGYNTEALYPANTIPAFETALHTGYEGFELDVRVTLDGKFAVSHDENLGVATTLSGKVAERTLDDIRQGHVVGSTLLPEVSPSLVRAYYRAPVPGLKEVFERFLPDPRAAVIVVDVKPDTDERLIAAAADAVSGIRDRRLLAKLIWTSRSEGALRGFRDLSPGSRFALEGSTGTEPFDNPETYIPERRREHDTASINLGLFLAPPTTHADSAEQFLRTAEARGYFTLAWTVSDVFILELMRRRGLYPDYLLSDAPYHRLAREMLREFDPARELGR